MKFQGKEVTILGVFAEQKAVSYDIQNLTAEEQAQARANIGIDISDSNGITIDDNRLLPITTTTDNSKILRVVDGKWQTVETPLDDIVQAVVDALPEWTEGNPALTYNGEVEVN